MSIVYSSKIQNRVMLSGEGNESWQKKSLGLISKKTEQLCTCNTLSHAFLFFSYTFYGGNVVCVPVHFFVAATHGGL